MKTNLKIIITTLFLFIASSVFVLAKAPSHHIWDTLLKKHVSIKGKVNYKGFIQDSVLLNTYLKILTNNRPTEATWTVNEQKAYWINAYNAFTVKLITQYYPVKSIKNIGDKIQLPFINTVWDIKFIKIGKDFFDLNNIEHDELRRKFNDARVHFALVCASKSCPVLLNEAYTAEKLEAQLNAQTKIFLNDKLRNNISASSPKLSKIFDWYAGDFKSNSGSVINFINTYTTIKIKPDANINYMVYSWDLNE